jgi:hypothetical protein
MHAVQLAAVVEVEGEVGPGSAVGGAEQGDAFVDTLAAGRIGREAFLQSRASWDAIVDGYTQHCADPSFVNYFWTLRSMQAPLFMLAEVSRTLPRARMLQEEVLTAQPPIAIDTFHGWFLRLVSLAPLSPPGAATPAGP